MDFVLLIHVLPSLFRLWRTSVLESGHQVDIIYLDLQKAFDRVPHARLISHMELITMKTLYPIGDNEYVEGILYTLGGYI